MNISICITVLNEEKSISRLLDSLLGQTRKPDEIIIVDAGSKDKTVQIIKHYQKKDRKIKLLIDKGNIAHGRNVGIEVAGNDIIATTDAGCIPHPDWLEKITKPFERQESPVGLVAGFYDMPARIPIQRAICVYMGIHPKRYDSEAFLPSTRSVAFKKQLWERVGGFDERLDKAGEDTQFFYNIVKTGARIVRAGEARVVWKELENITFKEAMGKFFNYAKGDAQAGIWWHPAQKLSSHNIKVIFVFMRYLAGIILLVFSLFNPALLVLLVILATLYILWSVYKWKDVITDWQARFWLPVIQIFSDFAVMSGFLKGIIDKEWDI